MISHEKLLQLVTYNPETGIFTANTDLSDKIKTGHVLGCSKTTYGYIKIGLCGKHYEAHRLAWFYITREWPDLLDHIDTNRTNNRFSNLRIATKAQNGMNARIRKDNTTGVKGIVWEERCNGFQARIAIGRKSTTKRFSVNKFDSKEAALSAAQDWVRTTREKLHGEFTNHG